LSKEKSAHCNSKEEQENHQLQQKLNGCDYLGL